jgi:hypothetical protein
MLTVKLSFLAVVATLCTFGRQSIKMKKFLLITAIAFFATTVSFAQRDGRTRFSIGPEIGIATSNPLKVDPGNKGWGLGLGVSAQVEHFFQQNFSGVFYAGYMGYNGRSSGTSTKNKAYTAIPIRIGGNMYAGNNLHLGAQLGVGLNNLGGVSATAFSYSPEIGYNFRSRNDKPLDLTLKLDGYAGNMNFTAVDLRLSLIL